MDSCDAANSRDSLLRIYKIDKLFISCLRLKIWEKVINFDAFLKYQRFSCFL